MPVIDIAAATTAQTVKIVETSWAQLRLGIAELALEKGAQILLVPVSCRRQLVDVSDEVATKLQLSYYADAADALRKALVE